MSERFFTCNLCEAQCGLRVGVEGARVTGVRGDPDDVLSRGHVCPKAHALRELYDDPQRLRAPVRRTATGWERVSWDDALSDVSARLRKVRRSRGRDAVALYVGNPVAHSHRAALGSQLLTMALGTKNRFDPNSQDSNPRLFACMQVYGDALSLPVPDVDRTDHLLMLGANPAASNGSQMGLGDVRVRMRGIRERGGRVVLVDPRRTESAAWADRHHFIRPGGDAALLFAMLHVLFSEGRVDARATAAASGGRELRELAARFPPSASDRRLASTRRRSARSRWSSWRRAARASTRASVSARTPSGRWRRGWSRRSTSSPGTSIARAGPCSRRRPPTWRRSAASSWATTPGAGGRACAGCPSSSGRSRRRRWPRRWIRPGRGGWWRSCASRATPCSRRRTASGWRALWRNLEHMVAVDYYVNETTRHARYILPPQHVFETGNFNLLLSRFTVRNVAKYSPPILRTGDDTRDDWDILSNLAARVALPGPLHRACHRAGRDVPERVLDLLLRLGPRRLSMRALREAPHGLDLGPLVPSRGDRVRTPDGRIRLAPPALVADVPRLEAWVDEHRRAGDLVLVGRRHLRGNNSWMNGLPSLAKGPDRKRLLVHPTDAARLGVADGDTVRVRSRTGRVSAVVGVTDDVMPGVVSLPHGFAQCSANDLTDDRLVEPVVGTSILNGVPVVLETGDAS